jgi:hypothetical protein
MATPDGAWRVDVVRTRSCQVFQVRQRAVVGFHGDSGWGPTGQIRQTVAEVQALLGDAFADLVEI